MDKHRRGNWESEDRLHRQLVESGFEHVSLVLQAESARQREDLVAELQVYKKLAGLIPDKHEGSRASLTRYAWLLERLWQVRQAHSLYARLAMMYPNDRDYVVNARRLAEYASVVDMGQYLIESEISLVGLARASMTTGTSLRGRYLINSLDSHATACVGVSPKALVDKYEQIRESHSEISLPRAEVKRLTWLSRQDIQVVDMVILASDQLYPTSGLELGLKFVGAGDYTLLVPVVIFEARSAGNKDDVTKHNNGVMDILREVTGDKPRSNAWLSIVHRHVNQAIRQLITKQLSKELWYSRTYNQNDDKGMHTIKRSAEASGLPAYVSIEAVCTHP